MTESQYEQWQSIDELPCMEDYYRGEIMLWASKNGLLYEDGITKEELSKRYWKEVQGLDV